MTTGTMTITIHKKRPDFRDIRGDLRARIKSLEETGEREQADFAKKQEEIAAEHKKSMDAIKGAIAAYKRMLQLEEALADHNMLDGEAKIGPMPDQVKIPMPMSRQPLADFLVAQVKERGSMTKEDLRLAALFAGYFDEGESGGRAVHATLMNLIKNKRLVVDIDGLYGVASEAEEARML